jgi:hypothetical protein
MPIITQPDATAVQLSASDENGKPVLSVLCKRTYEIRPSGQVVLAPQQVPLVQDFEIDPENPRRLHHDTDLYPLKLLTDVVVRGHAYGTGQRSFIATVQVGSFKKEVAIFGDRRCSVGSTGHIIFSEPKVIERIPLRYDRAFGGLDAVAQEAHGNPVEALGKYLDPSIDISGASPFAYPRNFAGVGYLIEPTPAAVERLVLPNLEDPLDRLSPSHLAVGDPMRWPLMPMPHAFDWVDPGTFPRLAYMGIVHDHEPVQGPIAEVARGYAPADVLAEKPVEEKANLRFTNGASLGLQLPHLQGGEQCMLGGLHPRAAVLKFQLPKERPEIKTDGRNGTMKSTKPVIHTVEIEPDAMRVSVVWRGAAPALRPYMAEELAKMPMLVSWR